MAMAIMKRVRVGLSVVVAVLAISALGIGLVIHRPPPPPGVRGNQLYDAAGLPLTIAGVARSGLEYACDGVGPYDVQSFAAMRRWNANTVRIAVSSIFWLDRDGSCPTYQALLHTVIINAEAAGLHVIIDLHREGHGTEMPNGDDLLFWQQFLPRYSHDPSLLVELFNEPHDVSWAVWHDGGTVHDTSGDYTAIGMQTLVTVANQLAPTTPVIVSGLNWEYDYSGMTGSSALAGKNLIYGVHLYNFPGKQPKDWQGAFGFLAAHAPVLITEFGDITTCDGSWLRGVLPQMQTQGIGMVAWAWLVSDDACHYPSVISDWAGTPSSYGQVIYDFYLRTFAAVNSPTDSSR